MTTTEDNDTNAFGRPGNRNAVREEYRWTCPYCGHSRTNAWTGESGRERAIAALRAHIRAADGADHGPTNEHPTDADGLALSEHVNRMEVRRTEADPSTLDGVFRSLADSRRRFVLSSLLGDSGGSATFDELVDGVVDVETYSPSPDRSSVAVTLDHLHLPLLAETGLIEYDRSHGVVQATSRMEQIGPYLGVVQNGRESDGAT